MQSQVSKASSPANLRHIAVMDPPSLPVQQTLGSAWPSESEAHNLVVIEGLIESAKANVTSRNHKIAAQLLERVLPALDEYYLDNLAGKVQVLRLLRDCYLALSKGVEAQDCTELALSIYEEMMAEHRHKVPGSGMPEPSVFARPVIRKLRSLRRARESEYLRKRSSDVAHRWQAITKPAKNKDSQKATTPHAIS